MKKLMVAAVAALLGAGAFAGTYYVNPTGGTVSSDDYDGSAETWQGGTVGPMKTLAAITKVANKSGDIIYAAAGTYNEGGVANSTYGSNRVEVASGVQLIATEGPTKTTIEGKLSELEGATNGFGTDSMRAVFLNNNAVVCGFTITKGRPWAGATKSDNENGGGGRGAGLFVDCVFTDNGTRKRGAHLRGSTALRCYIGSISAGAAGEGYCCYDGTKLVNCVVNSSQNVYSWCSTFNTTFVDVTHWESTAANGKSYNCLYLGAQPQCTLYNCYSVLAKRGDAALGDDKNQFSIPATELAYDSATYRPLKGSKAIDKSNDAYFKTATNGWSEAWQAFARKDYAGGARRSGAAIDVGAGEFDWAATYSKDLATKRVTVTEFSDAVHETEDEKVALPDGASLSLVWERADGVEGELDYSFTAAIPSGATLKVYRDGAAEPAWTMDETTEMPFTYQASAEQTLRFVAEGGEVVLSGFFDCGVVDIADASTGLTVTGAEKGHTELEPGASATVRISRNFTSDYTVSGFMLNGEFVSFDDHADDWVWEHVVDGPASSIRVVAVYQTVHEWYVDPAGDDGNDGRTKTRAVKTLAAASALAKTSGDVIHAAPGVYNEGAMAPVDTSSYTSNRVVLAAGVGLVGAGASVTAIEGQHATHDADAKGNGPDALRCVYCNSGAYVKGFTLRGGATNKKASSHDGSAGGGGLLYGTAIDCVITNNTCGYRGGGGNSVSFIRCKVSGNTSADGTGDDGNTCAYYGCVLSGTYYGSSDVYVNCTLLVAPGVNGGPLNAYNCVFEVSVSKLNLFNCVCKTALGTGCTTNDFCKVNVGATGVGRDAVTYRPLPGAATIDAGDWTFYTNKFPQAFLAFADVDFAQGPRKIGAAIDVGAGEYDWLADPPAGLTLKVTDKGDGTVEVAISRNFTSEKPTVGFTFGNETVMFDELDGTTWTKTVPTDALLENQLTAIYVENPTDWYVDPVLGNDSNPGYLPDCPKLTLTGAVACAKSGHIVHAAPGVYREGAKKDGSTMTRVVIPAGVGLVADGDGEHVIEGVISEGKGHSGLDSVRCVCCGTGAWIKGFTLRNGSTAVDASVAAGKSAYGDTGGGIYGGTAIDCIITNCYAVRGGGSSSATLIRCVQKDCHLEEGATNANGAVANTTATGMNGGSAYDSYIGDGTLNLSVVRNCRCYELWNNAGKPTTRAYNSYVRQENGGVAFTNCVVGVNPRSSCAWDEDTTVNTILTFDANSRPAAGQTLAIDRGKAEYYVYPDAFVHEQGVADIAGGQRVYNGAIDIGPGEYDWRGDFAKTLARRGVAVEAVSANVTTNAVAGLDLRDGETLEFVCTAKTDGKVSFRVTGAGTVTVTYGGEPLEPVEGVYSVAVGTGTSEVFAVSYAGEGVATVSDVILPRLGSLLLIR